MVDFNNDTTITRNARDILEILIIEKRTYFIDALEEYHKLKYNGRVASLDYVRSRLYSFYLELKPSLENEFNNKPDTILTKVDELITSKDYDNIIKCFELLSNYIYSKNLIKWDSMKTYNRQSIEEENKFHGMG